MSKITISDEYGDFTAAFSEIVNDLVAYRDVLSNCTIIQELGLGGDDVKKLNELITNYTTILNTLYNKFKKSVGAMLSLDEQMAAKISNQRDSMGMNC